MRRDCSQGSRRAKGRKGQMDVPTQITWLVKCHDRRPSSGVPYLQPKSRTCLCKSILYNLKIDDHPGGRCGILRSRSSFFSHGFLSFILLHHTLQYNVEELPGSQLEHLLGKLSHAGLYAFMTVMPITGVAMGYYGGTCYTICKSRCTVWIGFQRPSFSTILWLCCYFHTQAKDFRSFGRPSRAWSRRKRTRRVRAPLPSR